RIVLDHDAEQRALARAEPLQPKVSHDRPDRPRGQPRDLARRFLEIPACGLELASCPLELADRLVLRGASLPRALLCRPRPFVARFLLARRSLGVGQIALRRLERAPRLLELTG